MSSISCSYTVRARSPPAHRSSRFQSATYLAWKSSDSRSTVGMKRAPTDPANPVVCTVANPIATRPWVDRSAGRRPEKTRRASASSSSSVPSPVDPPWLASNSALDVQTSEYRVVLGSAFLVARSISAAKCGEGETASEAATVRRKRVAWTCASGSRAGGLADGGGGGVDEEGEGACEAVDRLEKADSILLAKDDVLAAAALVMLAAVTSGVLGLTSVRSIQPLTCARSWNGASSTCCRRRSLSGELWARLCRRSRARDGASVLSTRNRRWPSK